METVTTITTNGDGHVESNDHPPGRYSALSNQWVNAYWCKEERLATRQLRQATRRLVGLHLAHGADIDAVLLAAFNNMYGFVRAAVDERRARDHFEQLALDYGSDND